MLLHVSRATGRRDRVTEPPEVRLDERLRVADLDAVLASCGAPIGMTLSVPLAMRAERLSNLRK